jgi:putative inorganic carbon (HCO3(-)) transporter
VTAFHRLYQSFSWTELWVIAIAVLAGMLWAPALIAAPVIAIFYALLRLLVESKLPGPTPADLAILLLALLAIANFFLNASPENTVPALFRLFGCIALYYAIVHWAKTTIRLRWLLAVTALAILGLSLLSIFASNWVSYKLYFIPPQVYERFTLLFTDTIHPNVLAGSLIAVFPLALAIPLFAFIKSHPIERILYPVILLVISGVLILSQSRSALLALLVIVMIVLILRSAWFWSLPVLAAAALAIVMLVFSLNEVKIALISEISTAGLGQRLDIWQHVLFLLQDFPLTGVGMGNFPQAFQALYPREMNPSSLLPHAHNLFLQVGADLGIPGLVIWLSVLFASAWAAWQVFQTGKRWQQPWLMAMGAGLFGCQLAIIFHGMFDSVLWVEVRTAPLVWWLWGLSMAGLNLCQRAPRRGTGPAKFSAD